MDARTTKKETAATPFEILKTQVYPTLNQAMLKLIDHIVKTEEVRKHQERLAKQKLLDQLEKKKIEREREKEELGTSHQHIGSDYFESDDENYYKALEMDKAQVQTILKNRMRKNSHKPEKGQPEFGVENDFNPITFLVEQLRLLKSQQSANGQEKEPASH